MLTYEDTSDHEDTPTATIDNNTTDYDDTPTDTTDNNTTAGDYHKRKTTTMLNYSL